MGDTATRSWWREPLVHFILLAALVFAADGLLAEPSADHRLTADDAPVAQLRDDYTRQKGAPPAADAEARLIQGWLAEEALYRRAVELGLDQGDTVVRRRLVQRMRFLLEDAHPVGDLTEAQLESHYEAHPERYSTDWSVSFEHVFFSRGERGDTLSSDAQAVRAALQAQPQGAIEGDPFFRGRRFENISASMLTRKIGPSFTAAIHPLPVGQWSGPVASAYGLHVVRVTECREGRLKPLSEVKARVRDDLVAAERQRLNRAAIDALIERYGRGPGE
jgi:hypothetical protein